MWSFAPHDISVILSLAGGQLPDQVRCTGGDYLNRNVADTTLTAIRFPNGVRAHVFVSWLNPFKEQKMTVVGSSGSGCVRRHQTLGGEADRLSPTHQLDERPGAHGKQGQGEAVVPPESEPLADECLHFIECCRDRRIPRTDGHERLASSSACSRRLSDSLDAEGEAVDPMRAASGHRSRARSGRRVLAFSVR